MYKDRSQKFYNSPVQPGNQVYWHAPLMMTVHCEVLHSGDECKSYVQVIRNSYLKILT